MSVASKEVAKDVVPVTPEYWAQACAHLAKKDRVMKKLIPQFGNAILETRGDAFVTLARSIVGQQISVKAAQSVWDRFVALLGAPASTFSIFQPNSEPSRPNWSRNV